jgi:deoxyribodipyrimidine photolyase-like uncharacterized protein
MSYKRMATGEPMGSEQRPERPFADDARNCAHNLFGVRNGEDWTRFDAATDDFIAKHKDKLATSTLRRLLSEAYAAAAPEDYAGHRRILGQ